MRRSRMLLPLIGLVTWFGCSSSKPDAKVDVVPDQPGTGNLLGDDQLSGSGQAGTSPQSSCLGETHQAEVIGLDMFLMVDISSSMADALPGTNAASPIHSKWDAIKQSLEAFVQAPESADIGVGLQYFPPSQVGLPASCASNADCGASSVCASSACFTQISGPNPLGGRRNLTAFQFSPPANCLGADCLCSSNADCTGTATCRNMTGFCVVSGQGLLASPANDISFCETTADCAGLQQAGAVCEPSGICNPSGLPCTASIGCPAGAGTCQVVPPGCVNKGLCDAPTYSAPAVPISTAATRGQDIVASLEAVRLNGSTPTLPALTGALDQTRTWAAAHPGRQAIAVLATDGFPDACDAQQQALEVQQQGLTLQGLQLGIADVAKVASQANSGANPLRTFVIGVFSSDDLGVNGQQNLDSLAKAGGTQSSFVINTASTDVAGDFLQALDKIRNTAVSCEFQLDASGALDFDKVNLRVNDPKGGSLDLSNVGDVSACGQDQGWYYVRDENGTPTQIQVCPSTCARFSTAGVTADLQVGCATRIR